jgi:hypothetical protein
MLTSNPITSQEERNAPMHVYLITVKIYHYIGVLLMPRIGYKLHEGKRYLNKFIFFKEKILSGQELVISKCKKMRLVRLSLKNR